MSEVIETACPGCQRHLKIPASYLNRAIRCKYCGITAKMVGHLLSPADLKQAAEPHRAADAPRPANPPYGAPASESGSLVFTESPGAVPPPPASFADAASGDDSTGDYLERKLRRQRRVTMIWLSAALLLLVGLGVAAIIFHESLGVMWAKWTGTTTTPDDDGLGNPPTTRHRGSRPGDTRPRPTTTVSAATTPVSRPTQPVPPPTRPRPPDTRPVGPLLPTRFAAAYKDAARALIIGIRGYQNAPVVRPAQAGNDPKTADPLGINALRTTLVRHLGFRTEAVGLISDTARDNPIPPSREDIVFNLERFLKECRPQDRVVLAFVGHALVVDEHAYFVPIDGEPDKKDTLLSITWLYEKLADCPARYKLVMLDVAHPVAGREDETKLPAAFVKELQDNLPKDQGIQVWLSCQGGEHSQGFDDAAHAGGVFMFFLNEMSAQISDEGTWKRLRERPDIKDGKIPLAGFYADLNAELANYLKGRNASQSSLLFGEEKDDPGPAGSGPLAGVLVSRSPNAEQPADSKVIETIVRELKLKASPAMPQFSAKALADYEVEYKDSDFAEMLKKHPFRAAVVKATQYLDKPPPALTAEFRYPGNDMAFKNQVLDPVRKRIADLKLDYTEILGELRKVEELREKEKSARWRAHFDLTLARLLTRGAVLDDYNFIIGNKLYKDAPVPQAPNNGFKLTPSADGPTYSRDAKAAYSERNKLLDRLEKENPKTPWAFYAKQERSAPAGYKLDESRL